MSIEITQPCEVPGAQRILTDEALEFVAELHRRFAGTRQKRLDARHRAQQEASAAGAMEFPPETLEVRESAWTVAQHPAALRDRRAEIVGPPVPATMAIDALNSGASVWLACVEDALSPQWRNVIEGQLNLFDAARGTLSFTSPDGREHRLRKDAELPTIVVRPRGWHLDEKHIEIDGRPAIAALVDFGLHFFHNAALGHANSTGPFYYLPKLERYLEARLWDDVFTFSENRLGLPHGTVRATVLIETIPAAFHMDEILYELRDHASGLNAGRWDYLFSIIKHFRDAGEGFVMPDRAEVSMTQPFMRAYSERLVQVCHRLSAFAMGGMAAFIPNLTHPEITEQGIAKVREYKAREARDGFDGFDGSWVAHPDLDSVCREEFDAVLGDKPNQFERTREDVDVTAAQLLNIAGASSDVAEAGVRANLYVAIYYTAIWLSGNGAVAIHNLMEDAATAEISRSQVWQQIANKVSAADSGQQIDAAMIERLLAEVVDQLRGEVADEQAFAAHFAPAAELIQRLIFSDEYSDFLTLPAYELLP